MLSKHLMWALALALIPTLNAHAWGKRGHAVIDRAAIESLPADGPVFLHKYIDYIADSAGLPDSWRSSSEPFTKIEEDPNHGWFMEQFSFMHTIPRSRYEYVIALYRQNLLIAKTDPEGAKKINVRWTGTLPFAVMEVYGRLVANMRSLRAAKERNQDTSHLELNCAMYTFWLGHYVGDGAQPLHDTIHHDGWQGANPHNYTRDPKIHGRFESQYVEQINLTDKDILPRIGSAGSLDGDVFDLVLDFLKKSNEQVEEIYRLDKQQAFTNPQNEMAREMVYTRTAAGARLLRDLLNRAWLESANAPKRDGIDPNSDQNPAYNPETGSAPASISTSLKR